MSERTYPDPAITLESEPYWEATKAGKLLLKKCNACGEPHFYPRSLCPHCGSTDVDWLEASGKGTIYSYSVMRRAKTPYAIAYVTLDEGVTMMTNIVDADLDGLAVGQAVEVAFRPTEGGHALPVFKPA
ncbi:MAG: Zn-ribbon domain-containing OB-fold protein [Alphaproteobacteria bacterium]